MTHTRISFLNFTSYLLFLVFIIGRLTAQSPQIFNYTGGVQTFTVPPCVNSVTLEVWGAQGGIDISSGGWDNNLGGYASAVFTAAPGQVMNIYVGEKPAGLAGGFNGGGMGYPSTMFAGMGRGGGGATDIRMGGIGLNNRIIVAGGGGGGGSDIYGNWVIGGGGGGLVGVQGQCYDGGCAGSQPGTQTSSGPGICAGVLNTNVSGGFGFGGDALYICGDGFGCGSAGGSGEAGYGGGGGWYGGSGGSSNFGGSGGSGYISPASTNNFFATAVQGGHGLARISYGVVMNLAMSNPSCVSTGSASVLASLGFPPYTYTWSGSAQTTSLVTGLSPGIHTVTVSDAGSCTALTATVLITNTLSATVLPGCSAGNSATLTTTGGSAPYTYTWSGTAQTTSVVTGLSAGSYTVRVSDLNGCQTRTTSFNTPTTLSLTALGSSCAATSSANAFASGGLAPYSYLWTGTAQTTSMVTGLAAGQHTVTVSDLYSCQTKTAVVDVTTPSPIVVSNTALCIGYSATMTAVAATSSFTWSPGANLSTTSASLVSANPSVTTIYSISTTNSLNCVSSTTAQLYVVPTQTVPLITPTTCLGQGLNLIANITYTGALYSWSGPGGYTSALQNPTITAATFTNSGVYSLTVVSAPGCTSSAVTDATVFAMPSPGITSNSPVCTNQTLTLNGSGATSYSWAGPAPGNFLSVSQNTTIVGTSSIVSGIYTLTGSFATGCKVSITQSLTVRPLPATSFTNSNPVCVNGTLALLGSGGSSYLWNGPGSFTSALQNPSITNVQQTASGIYTLLATLNSCTASTTQSVTVNLLPAATATNNSSVCATNSLQLGSSGGTSYLWDGPLSFTSALQSPFIASTLPVNSGSYTVTVTDANGCIAQAITIATVLPNPTLTATGATVCLNESAMLSVAGGTSCAWAGPSAFSSALYNPTITVVDNLTAGIYSMIVTSANSCTSAAAVTLSFMPLPTLTAISASVCLNTAATLSVSGAASYSWAGPNSYSAAGAGAPVPLVNALSVGIYTVLGMGANTCTSITNASLTAKALPVVTATGTIVCIQQKALLSSAGSTDVATYGWSGPGSYTAAVQNPTIVSATSAVPVNYTVLVTALNSCTQQAVTTLSTYPLPIVAATSTIVCKNQPFTILASGASTYTWSGPLGTSNGGSVAIANVNSVTVGGYTVTGQNVNTCTNVAVAMIDTLPLPHVTAIGNTVCIGSPATLKAFGASSFFWQGPGGYTSSFANAVISNANSMTTQEYTVVGTAPNSCTQVAYALLGTYPLPTPTIVAPPRVCMNSVLQLKGAGANTYTWTGPYKYSSSNKEIALSIYNVLQAGNYTLSVTDNLGCKNFTTTYVKVDPLPQGKLVSDNANNFCVPFCSVFRLQSTGASPVVNSSWMLNGQTLGGESFSTCVTGSGSNGAFGTFTNALGCVNSMSFVLPANLMPKADFYISPEKPVEELDLVEFYDNSTGRVMRWNWYFVNNDGYTSSEKNTSHKFNLAGSYPVALVVENDKGCSDTIVKTIVVEGDFSLFVPNSFTPDGDGLNDIFQPKGRGLSKYLLSVYDRWGKLVFETEEFEKGWDGSLRGGECAPAVYVWKIKGLDTKGRVKDLMGYVTLAK